MWPQFEWTIIVEDAPLQHRTECCCSSIIYCLEMHAQLTLTSWRTNDLRIARICLSWLKQRLVTTRTCCTIDSSASSITPRQVIFCKNGMSKPPRRILSHFTLATMASRSLEPSTMNCVLSAFNLSLFDDIHMSVVLVHEATRGKCRCLKVISGRQSCIGVFFIRCRRFELDIKT